MDVLSMEYLLHTLQSHQMPHEKKDKNHKCLSTQQADTRVVLDPHS